MSTPNQAIYDSAVAATADIDKLIQMAGDRSVLHAQHQGVAMSDDVWNRFSALRDEKIPALRQKLIAQLAAAPAPAPDWLKFDIGNPPADGLYWVRSESPEVDVDVDDYGQTVGRHTGGSEYNIALVVFHGVEDSRPEFEVLDKWNSGDLPSEGWVTHYLPVCKPVFPKATDLSAAPAAQPDTLSAEQIFAIRDSLEAAAIQIWGPHFAYTSADERVFSQGFRSGWGAREHEKTIALLGLASSDAARTTLPGSLPATGAEINWPKEKRVGRREDMSPDGTLVVGLDSDNDVYIEVSADRHGEWQSAAVEFCNGGGGGGQSSRTRAALINLMTAIEADNEAGPHKAFPRAPISDQPTDKEAAK